MTTTAKRVVASILLAIGPVVAIVVALSRSPEPSFEGKKIGSWLKDLDDWDGSSNAAVVTAIQAIGANGIPCLLKCVAARDSRFEAFLCKNRYFVLCSS